MYGVGSAFRTLRTPPRDDAGTAEAAPGGGPVRRARGSPTRKKRVEKWTPGRETPKIEEMLASRAIECWPLVPSNAGLFRILVSYFYFYNKELLNRVSYPYPASNHSIVPYVFTVAFFFVKP